jgi:[pyruvate, water dikinase]-phosphate phosphotransferase / [pyruvate, water dikinase] kinase
MDAPLILIVSGGAGASGERLVQKVLAQFPEGQVHVRTASNVYHMPQVEAVVAEAAEVGGIIVHTMVNSDLRRALTDRAAAAGVAAVDLMGTLLDELAARLRQAPLERPGLYRRLRQAYFDRVEAIEFTMDHDDGKHSEDWTHADIVLTGVSRVGKTPLSMYLAVLGWKVANVPLVMEIPPPSELFELNPKRVIGLTIEAGQLLRHRQQRQLRLGLPSGGGSYDDPTAVYEELESARHIFRKGGFSVIDITDKPIETSAEEIINMITRRFGDPRRREDEVA